MRYIEFKDEVICGVKSAFNFTVSDKEVDEWLTTDPIAEEDWMLAVGENMNFLKLHGAPVFIEVGVIPPEEAKEVMIIVHGGVCKRKDERRAGELICELDNILSAECNGYGGYDLNDCTGVALYYTVKLEEDKRIRDVIVDVINGLTCGESGKVAKELFNLCNICDLTWEALD